MMTPKQAARARARAAAVLRKARIAMTPAELAGMETADFGLGEFERTGLSIVVYVNNDRYCAKELILLPGQTCPEHRHPAIEGRPGKRETFRCRWGRVFLYVEGKPKTSPRATPPAGGEAGYTVFHEIALSPGDQHTVGSDTLHWFQAGVGGAVVSEFSSPSRDEADIFTDPRIRRVEGAPPASRGAKRGRTRR